MKRTDSNGPSPESLLRDVTERRFRSNPAYRLVAHVDLDRAQQAAFVGFGQDPGHYGVLVPVGHIELGVLAVDHATAELFSTLAAPGPLPESLRGPSTPDTNSAVVKLVLDGVLEIERDGHFLSGPLAREEVLLKGVAATVSEAAPSDRISHLSVDALRLAQGLPITEPRRLASWLYGFNTLPASPRWMSRLGASGAGRGAEERHPILGVLEPDYASVFPRGWISWHLRDRELEYAAPAGTAPAYKLYVSPHPAVLPDVLRALADAILELRPPAFKLGADVFGLLRPDKLMVYFDDLRELEAFARRLRSKIMGVPAQGVPFTASMESDGLLSWGVDPPRSTRIPGWTGSESWRAWLVARLARALISSRAVDIEALEPWVCALDRISVEGIDAKSWTPTDNLWTRAPVT